MGSPLIRGNAWLVVLFLVVGLLLLVAPVYAGLTVAGSKFLGTAKPGETVTHVMEVMSQSDVPPMDIEVEVLGFGQEMNRAYVTLDPSMDRSSYTARPFIILDKTSFHLDPGKRQMVNAEIRVPSNAGSGGRYAIIRIHQVVSASGRTVFVTAVNVPVLLTISASGVTLRGEITDISAQPIVTGQPLVISTTLKNIGNHHYYGAYNEVTLTDSSGGILANTTTSKSIHAIIPESSVWFNASLGTSLSPGTYTVVSKMFLEDGTLLDEKTTTLAVEKPYFPPFMAASVIVRPGNAASLLTSDNRFSIQFPQGAVIAETKVSIAPFAREQLPQAPEGSKHAVTCFRIEGLTGLLSKEATIVVKYTPDDVAAAGGDAGKLVLARWDEGELRWTMLPTTVDRSAGTLTASTNHFSTWSIIVGSAGGLTGIPGFETAAACMALIAIVLEIGRRRKE